MKTDNLHIIESPSTSYLDQMVAAQKQEEHLKLILKVQKGQSLAKLLKTDLFEETNLSTFLLDDSVAANIFAVDISEAVLKKAKDNFAEKNIKADIRKADVRDLPFADSFFDMVVSTSTLDHFTDKKAIYESLDELKRVIKSGGILVVTMDNPKNPMYYLLKLLSFMKITPFFIGKTLSAKELETYLGKIGFTVLENTGIIHNPRVISTFLFKAVRLLMGRDNAFSDGVINFLLKCFALQGKTFLAKYSACFIAVTAVKK